MNDTEGHINYTYDFLLERVKNVSKDKNASQAEASKNSNKVSLSIARLGSTKTTWINFGQMATAIDRTNEHMISYISAELGNEANMGIDNNLII